MVHRTSVSLCLPAHVLEDGAVLRDAAELGGRRVASAEPVRTEIPKYAGQTIAIRDAVHQKGGCQLPLVGLAHQQTCLFTAPSQRGEQNGYEDTNDRADDEYFDQHKATAQHQGDTPLYHNSC